MNYLPLNDEHILHFAFRYALGRPTAAPSIVATVIRENMGWIRPATKKQMLREIREAIMRDDAGDPCDVARWRELERDLSL